MLVFMSQSISLLVKKKELFRLLKLEEVSVLLFATVVGHERPHHGRCAWSENHGIR